MKYLILFICLLSAMAVTGLMMKAQASSCYVGGSPLIALIQKSNCFSGQNATLKATYTAKNAFLASWFVENSATHQILCSGNINSKANETFSLSCQLTPSEKFAIVIPGGSVVDYPTVVLKSDYLFLSPPATPLPARPTIAPSSDLNGKAAIRTTYLPLVIK